MTCACPVLVVDDDWDIREAMKDALGDAGYQTFTAASGPLALEYLRAQPPPGLILLDWNMTPMNGPQFIAELGNDPRLAQVPVVVVTADSRAEGNTLGRGLLKKPVDLDVLFEVVARYCRPPR